MSYGTIGVVKLYPEQSSGGGGTTIFAIGPDFRGALAGGVLDCGVAAGSAGSFFTSVADGPHFKVLGSQHAAPPVWQDSLWTCVAVSQSRTAGFVASSGCLKSVAILASL